MSVIENSTTIFLPIETVWQRLIEFSRWSDYHMFAPYKNNGLGDTLRPLGGEGSGVKFGVFEGPLLMQTYSITEWEPPKRLVLTMDPWKWESGSYLEGKRLPGYLGKFNGKMKALKSTYSFTLSPAMLSRTQLPQTQLDVRIFYQYTHEFWGPINHIMYWFPIKWSMQKCAANFIENFVHSFDDPKGPPGETSPTKG